MLQIEPGIPVPTSRTKYPFGEMLPGDSILFIDGKLAASARVAALRFSKIHQKGWQFRMRKVSDGWRLWRID
jgi:hypothetical protein